ncbi:hypothetical protein V6N13_013356 [Hibiscus sabdariffa]
MCGSNPSIFVSKFDANCHLQSHRFTCQLLAFFPFLRIYYHSPSLALDATQAMKMKPQTPLHFSSKPFRPTAPLMQFDLNSHGLVPNFKRLSVLQPPCVAAKFPLTGASLGRTRIPSVAFAAANPHLDTQTSSSNLEATEERIEKLIYRCRFMTLLAVLGSLTGSFLCFVKGCTYIVSSFMEYFVDRSKVILLLVEAIDVYLLGTVMLVFGMGLYELFVSNLDIAKAQSKEKAASTSNLFGMFALKERPRWLEIKSVSELKTKLGHVIVMLLLIGFFDKCKKTAIHSTLDLLCFSASVLLSSSCLFLLSKLNGST